MGKSKLDILNQETSNLDPKTNLPKSKVDILNESPDSNSTFQSGRSLENQEDFSHQLHSNINNRGIQADSQSWMSQAKNSILGGTLSGLATAVQDFSYIPQLFSNKWEENMVSSAMIGAKESIDKILPIYTKTDGLFDWNDGAFVWKALKGTLDSAVGFAIPGGVVSKGLEETAKAVKLAKLAQLASESPQVYEAMMSLGSGYVMNRMEGTMMGVELYNNSMKNMESDIESGKISRKEAEEIAAQKANEFRNWNTLFAITDAIGVHGIVKGEGFIRNLKVGLNGEEKGLFGAFKELSAENPIVQGLKEGFEEVGQNTIQSEKEYETYKDLGLQSKAENLSTHKNLLGRVIDFATSSQALYEGMLGVFGGYPQHILTKAVSGGYSAKAREAEQNYIDAQKKQIEDNTAYLKNFNDIQTDYSALKAEAVKRGDNAAIEALDKLNFTNVAVQNFTNGTVEHLERSLDDIINETPEQAQERGHDETSKTKAQQLKSELKTLSKDWLNSSGYINHEEVFLTKQNIKVAKSLYNNALQESSTLENQVQNEATRIADKINKTLPKNNIFKDLSLSFDINALDKPILQSELLKPYYEKFSNELKGTPEWEEYFNHKDTVLNSAEQHLNDLNKKYKEITSDKYQETVKTIQEKIQEKVAKKEEKEKEKEVVQKHKEKVEEIKKETSTPTEEVSTEEEGIPNIKDFVDKIYSGEIEETPENTAFYEANKEAIDSEIARREKEEELSSEDKTIVLQTETQSEEVSSTEVSMQEYTNETQQEVEENTISAEVATKSDLSQDEKEYDKVEFGSNILAYLSRKYKGWKSRNDVDNILNEDIKNQSILDPNKINVGTKITLKIKDNDDVKMYIPGTKELTTWGAYKIAHNITKGTPEYNNLVPIVVLDSKGNELADLHTTDWIREENIYGDTEEDNKKLVKLREVIVNNDEVKTTVTRRTNGKLFKLTEGSITLNEAFPDKSLHFTYLTKGEITGLPVNILENLNTTYLKEGITYIVLPVNKDKYIPVPISQVKVSNTIANSLSTAARLWFTAKGDIVNLKNEDRKLVESLYNNYDVNLLEIDGLRKYFTLFINSYSIPQSIEANIKQSAKAQELSELEVYLLQTNIKSTTHLLQIKGNSIDFGNGKSKKDFGSISFNTPNDKAYELLDKLTQHIQNMYMNINYNLMNKNEIKIPIINQDNTINDINNNSSYKDFVRNNAKSSYISHNIGTGENPNYIYTIQPVIEYDTDFLNNVPVKKETSKEESNDIEVKEVKKVETTINNPITGKPVVLDDFDPDALPLSNNEIEYILKSVNILQSDRAKQIFAKGEKNKWDLDKILTELTIPKEQKQLILNSGKSNREDIITDLLANYSYTIEINTAKSKSKDKFTNYGDIEDIEAGEYNEEQNTQYYSNLTVPGGTNYTENEIAIPGQLVEEKPKGVPVKEGVSELFESNPELANAVYEALGFNNYNVELKPYATDVWGKVPQQRGDNSFVAKEQYSIKLGEDKGIDVRLTIYFDDNNKTAFVSNIENFENDRTHPLKKGLGLKGFLKANQLIINRGYTPVVDNLVSGYGYDMLSKLEKSGYLTKVLDKRVVNSQYDSVKYERSPFIFTNKIYEPELTPQQKQQAQQLYSQYLEQNPNGSIEEFKSWVDNKNNFDKELAQKIQDKLEKLYPEIKLNITNNPIWEQGDNVFNQLIEDDYFEGNFVKYQNEIERISALILNKLKYKLKDFNGKYDESITSVEEYKTKVLNDLLKNIGINGVISLNQLKDKLSSTELQTSLMEELQTAKTKKEEYAGQLEEFYHIRRLLNNYLKHFDLSKYDASQQLKIKTYLPSLFKDNKFKSDKQAIAFSKRQINSSEWANKKFNIDKISIFFLGQNAKISKIETLINYFKIDKQDAVERIYNVVENELNRREKFFTSEKTQSKINAKIAEDKIKADNEKAERLRIRNEELNKYKNSTVVKEVEGFLGARNIHDLESVLESSNINVELATIKNNGYSLDKTPEGKDSNLFASILNLPEVNGNVEIAKKLKSLVYSEDFINWFGDWLNNPEESSKIVDENGEPKLVYHGSGREFFNFEEKERGSTTGKWQDRLSDSEMSFMFTDSPNTAFYYAIIERQQILKEILYYVRKAAQEPSTQMIQEMYQNYPAIKNWVDALKQKGLTKEEILKEFNRIYNEYSKIRDLSEGGAIGNAQANNEDTKQIIDYLEKNKDSILKKGIPKNDKYNTAIIPGSEKNGYPIWLWSSKEYNTITIRNDGILNSFENKSLNGKNIKELSSSEYDLMVEEFKNNFVYNYQKIQDELQAGGFRPKVYPVFLNAKNVNSKDFKNRPFVFQQGDTEEVVKRRKSKGAAFEVADLIENALKDNLDGSIIKNIADPTVSTNYAVFKSNQIKSVFNKKDYTSQDNFYNQISNGRIIGQANIKAMTVLIDAVNQKQDTLPHEYAHHYIAWFRNTPIVQEAIKKWGSEESLVQSIGEQVVKQKGEAYNWWSKFVKWIMNQFNSLSKLQKEELTQILTDAFLTRQDLGSKQDIEGFKEFIKDNTKTVRKGAITPSIKGHAQFATDNGIGWGRWDEKIQYTEKDIDSLIDILKKSGQLEINCK